MSKRYWNPTSTPWGPAQHEKEIAPGITSYSTVSHGGIRLSDERQKVVDAKYPHFQPWAGKGWYEEDCDVAIVFLTFPEYFLADTIEHAKDALKRDPKYFGITDVATV